MPPYDKNDVQKKALGPEMALVFLKTFTRVMLRFMMRHKMAAFRAISTHGVKSERRNNMRKSEVFFGNFVYVTRF